ncbi:MAG: NeuD/PglB/VioB family sugar acetyltransferase [bacterium]|nr:NeuD/PglB/VioB family sugar acetyltransferase [bacterium]
MPIKKVVIIGGIGNGSVIAAALDDAAKRDYGEWEVAGYLNDRLPAGSDLEGHPALGSLQKVEDYLQQGYYFIYTIFRIDGQDQRLALLESLKIPDEKLATFVHPKAYVAPNVKLGPGCVVMPNASISSGATLGKGCLVMVNATIGHNDQIGNCCHIAAQACISSFVTLGKGVHVGLNATIRENLTLGDYSAVAMGAVLLNNVGDGEIWAGVPAKLLRLAKKELP